MKNVREQQLVVCSNMLNEIDMLHGLGEEKIGDWFKNFSRIANGGIIIVDGGSIDGTIEYFEKLGAFVIEKGKQIKKSEKNIYVIIDNVIQIKGYGPARNHLRQSAKVLFPDANWCAYFDADERISENEFHTLRFLKDYLNAFYDVIAFPRVDWGLGYIPAKHWLVNPDYQARMTRLDSPIVYVRKLHEQITGYRNIYANISTPKINHYHRFTDQKKRDFVGRLCSKLHMEDTEYGDTYPEHKKEAYYRELLEKEGL